MSNVLRLVPLPVEFEPLCDNLNDSHTNHLRAVKERVERIADLYLHGQYVPILSASLRGPLGPNWRNPWAKRTITKNDDPKNAPRGNRQRQGLEAERVGERTTIRHEARQQRQDRAHALELDRPELSGRRLQLVTQSRQKLDGVVVTPHASVYVTNLLHGRPRGHLHLDKDSRQAIPQCEEINSLSQGVVEVDEIDVNGIHFRTDHELSSAVVQRPTFTAVNRPGRVVHQMQRGPEDDDIVDATATEVVSRLVAAGAGQGNRKRARDRPAAVSRRTKTCTDCGIVATKWRPGPQGPATLCDSCGNKFYRQKRQIGKTGLNTAPASRSGQGGVVRENHQIAHPFANVARTSNSKPAPSNDTQLFEATEGQQNLVDESNSHSLHSIEPGAHHKIMKKIFPHGIDIALQRVDERSPLSRPSSFNANGAPEIATESIAPTTKAKRVMMFDTPPSMPSFRIGLRKSTKPKSPEAGESAAPYQHDATDSACRAREVLVAVTPQHTIPISEAYLHRADAQEFQELVPLAEQARVNGAPVEPSPHIELLERYTNTILTPADVNRVKRIMQQSASSWKSVPKDVMSDSKIRLVDESPYLSTQAAFRKAQVEFQEELDSPMDGGASKSGRSQKPQRASILKTALRGSKRKSDIKYDEVETPSAMPSTQALFAAAEDIRFDSGSRSLTQRDLSFNISPVAHKTAIGGARHVISDMRGDMNDFTIHAKQLPGTSSTPNKREELQHLSFATPADTSIFRLELPARQPSQDVHLLVGQAQSFLGDWSVEKALRETRGSSVSAVC